MPPHRLQTRLPHPLIHQPSLVLRRNDPIHIQPPQRRMIHDHPNLHLLHPPHPHRRQRPIVRPPQEPLHQRILLRNAFRQPHQLRQHPHHQVHRVNDRRVDLPPPPLPHPPPHILRLDLPKRQVDRKSTRLNSSH